MADLANNTAATSAGYTRTQTDFGSGHNPRYVTLYEKPMSNDDMGGFLEKARGESNSSQAAADTAALAALNEQRRIRHGAGNRTPRGTTRSSIDN